MGQVVQQVNESEVIPQTLVVDDETGKVSRQVDQEPR